MERYIKPNQAWKNLGNKNVIGLLRVFVESTIVKFEIV